MKANRMLASSLLVAALLSPGLTYAATSETDLLTRAYAAANGFEEQIPGLLNDHIMLGTGYNSNTKKFLNVQTVDGVIDETTGNTLVTFELVNNGTYEDVLRQLNGNVDAGVNFPVVRVDAGGHIAKELASTEFSNTYTFQASLTPKKRVLRPRDAAAGYALTDAGDIIARAYQSKMLKLAGDSFISEIEYGAQLLINLKIEYLSEQHKSDIGGYLGVSYGVGSIGISVDGKLNYIDEDLKRSVRITVRAIQRGGDPKQLLSVIPNNIISCSLDNYEPCFNMFEQVVNYAKDDFGNQFNSLSDYNVVRYTAVPYGVSSVDVRRLDAGNQVIRFETTYRTLWLEEQFKKSVTHEHRARSILAKYSSWMTDEQREKAETVQQAAYNNAWVYSEYATLCRDNPYGFACSDSWSNYELSCNANDVPCIETYSLSDLNIPAGSMTKYFRCESAREASANFGVEDNETSIGYRTLGWAPIFIDPDDPEQGVLAWLPCSQALSTFGSAFPEE